MTSLFFGLVAQTSFAEFLTDARTNNTEAVTAAISAKEDVNARSSDGTTALHWAVYNNNGPLVRALIRAGADVNARNDYGSSPMSEAGVLGSVELLELLLDAGADVESPTLEGQTALMSVVRTPHVEAAELLIERGANVNAFETWRGQTALMFAAAQSQPAMVELLLEHGAEPNAVSALEEWERQVTAEPRPQGRPFGALTALLLAAREGCVECTRALVEHGAAINQVDPNGITPLLMATLNARWDVAAYLIEAGADVNRWDTWGRAPLYSTVDYNTVPRGGRPDRPSQDTVTPVQLATMLLEKGANPNMQLKVFPPYRSLGNDRGGDSMLSTGTTPLIRATKAADIAMTDLLLKHGALVNLKNWAGYTPIMAVAGLGTNNVDIRGRFRDEKNGIAVAQLLVAAGAELNAKEDQGRAAIHGAAQQNWGEFIRYLAGAGADINQEDRQGNTALDMAMGKAATGRFASTVEPNEKLAGVLLELGAKPGSAQSRPVTPPAQ
ncbi:MAG: ankyrin repeat domain-containing protein [Pseudomonadota bacterium]